MQEVAAAGNGSRRIGLCCQQRGSPTHPGRDSAGRADRRRLADQCRSHYIAARADAQRSAGAAQAKAQRITADARAAAQHITAAAQAAAQAAARRGPGERGLNAREWSDVSGHFLLQELAAANAGFADSHCMGRGGFGSVFFTVQLRAMGGADLAIKMLDLGSMQGQTEFLQEV
jgi:hypothetical protein